MSWEKKLVVDGKTDSLRITLRLIALKGCSKEEIWWCEF
jgi:hypothetical protein